MGAWLSKIQEDIVEANQTIDFMKSKRPQYPSAVRV